MSGQCNYEKDYMKLQMRRTKSEGQCFIDRGKEQGFPNCKGTYPDCPEVPDKEKAPCRSCPVLDED